MPLRHIGKDAAVALILFLRPLAIGLNAMLLNQSLAPSLEGVNPFKYGLIGGTDSHNADPGNTVERDFQGRGGTGDAPVAALLYVRHFGCGAL